LLNLFEITDYSYYETEMIQNKLKKKTSHKNDYQILDMVCMYYMDYYNFLLGLCGDNEVDNIFFQEKFDQYKIYDC